MIAAERQLAILRHLDEHSVATTQTLVEVTGSSAATVRRDLSIMDERGLITRTRGGAETLRSDAEPPRFAVASSQIPHYGAKLAIARLAARMIQPGDTVFLGAGQTCALLARQARDVPGLKVVTTSINSVLELVASPEPSILLLGGDIHVGPSHIETLDEYTLHSLSKYYFDKAFITVDGVDLDFGYSINSRRQLPLYEHLMGHSHQFVIMVDHSKFGRRAFTRFAPLADADEVITDAGVDPKYLKHYAEHRVNVRLAEATDPV